MIATILGLALATAAQDPSDAIYNENTFAEFRITMAVADWNAIVNDPFGSGDLWKRCSVQWQGDPAMSDVGIKAVGTNRGAGNPKPAVRLKFDEFVPGREWRGVDDLKLEGSIIEGFNERISYWTYRQFAVPAPRAVHAQVWVNGDLKGVYEVVETVRKKMIRYHMGILNPDGNLYKIDRHPNGNTNWSGDHYLWRGSTPSTYVPGIWEAVTNEIGGNYADVVALLDILNNAPQAERRTRLDATINLDKFYSYLAVLAATGDHDSLHAGDAPSTPNNHFWYHREDTNRMQVIPWDSSNTFGPSYWLSWNEGVAMNIWFGIDPAVTSSTQWDGRSRTNTKATAWMAPDGTARAAYLSKLRQLIDGPFPNAVTYINSVNTQIRTAVLNDPYDLNPPFDARVQQARDWVPARIAAIRSQLPPTVTVDASDPNAAEPTSPGTFTITRVGSTSGALTVNFQITGTASNGTDYSSIGTSVTIASGSASATVTVTPTDDPDVEGSETVVLTLSSSSSYVLGATTSDTVTIADNDTTPPPTPSVTVAATDGNAAEAGTDPGTFTITRSTTAGTITVGYALSGTATSGDYSAVSGSVTLNAGQGSATVTITPVNDTIVESSETVVLTLSAGAGYTVGAPSSATVTISDNDTALPDVTVAATVAAAAEPSTAGTFTITRTGSTSAALTVTYTVTGTATGGTDYAALSTSVSIAVGQASTTVTVSPIDDLAAESGETVILTISASPAYTVGAPSGATVTIADDDAAGTVATFQDGAAPAATYAGTRDATLSQNAPAVNLGSNATLGVDGDEVAGSDLEALLRWDLSSIAPGSVVQSAIITLNVTNSSTNAYPLYELRQLWVESQATWTVYATGSAWQIAGAQGALDRGTTVLGTLAPTAAGPYVLTLNAAGLAIVQSWINSPGTNFGLVVAHPSNVDGVVFDSREAPVVTNRPKLSVRYAPAVGGLSVTYYDNSDFTGASVTGTDPGVDFNWVAGSPAPGIGPDTFSARWTGRVRAEFSELYTFYTFTNDGVRLWVEGELLVDRWVLQSGGVEWSGQIALQAGRWYTVQMDYYENTGNAVARLLWSSPSTPKEVIPASQLGPATSPPDSRDNDGDGIPNDADPDDDNDGIPDLQDTDRDGDGATNLVEDGAGTDPSDRTSVPGGPGGGPPVSTSAGENENGDAWINDRCAGGSIRAFDGEFWLAVAALLPLLFAARGRKSRSKR